MVEFAQPLSAVWAHQKGMMPQVGLFFKTKVNNQECVSKIRTDRLCSIPTKSESGGWVPGMRMGISSSEKDSVRVKVLTGYLEVPAG